ncbi:hypothetical protein BBF96_06990 [Anoxybacter fermentans]|uniref:Lipoprotein YerB n=1 Tax=Anoxybacter fermentans TaxID=1323375 RepID=A0A3S9SY17_9FIRM|nr:DUF3048 domain-containing protein [Anoxybacter fermentans]AZR73150.1 hypothetical protein BBF96_06990 [Anoxybacter fermentans]
MGKTELSIVFILVLIIVLSGCGKKEEPVIGIGDDVESDLKIQRNIEEESLFQTRNGKESNESDLEEDDDPIESRPTVELKMAPFLGKLMKEFQLPRPIMVMVENAPAARPQAGLEDASIVYEFLVEGGITRFLALYYEKFPERVGPIRSTRPYFIQTALEYDALLLHAGASPEGFHMLVTTGIDHLDQIRSENYYWRSSKRRAPHNLYTGINYLREFLSNYNSDAISLRFPYQSVGFVNQAKATPAHDIKIHYWGGYTVEYKYDDKKGNYLRFIDGVPHLMEGGKKIYAYNIFVQYVDTKVKDDEGRLEMKLVGSNKALLFKDGFVFKGTWIKEKGEKTHFLDADGNEWKINPGQTWIQVVPLSTKVEYQ